MVIFKTEIQFATQADHDKFVDEVSSTLRYERMANKDKDGIITESKEAYISRTTVNWWIVQGSQGKAKKEVDNWNTEYETMITRL